MDDIKKIVKSLKESGLSIKRIRAVIKNKTKEQKGGYLSMQLGTLTASLLGNLVKDTGVKWPKSSNIPGWKIMTAGEDWITAGKETNRADQDL